MWCDPQAEQHGSDRAHPCCSDCSRAYKVPVVLVLNSSSVGLGRLRVKVSDGVSVLREELE